MNREWQKINVNMNTVKILFIISVVFVEVFLLKGDIFAADVSSYDVQNYRLGMTLEQAKKLIPKQFSKKITINDDHKAYEISYGEFGRKYMVLAFTNYETPHRLYSISIQFHDSSEFVNDLNIALVNKYGVASKETVLENKNVVKCWGDCEENSDKSYKSGKHLVSVFVPQGVVIPAALSLELVDRKIEIRQEENAQRLNEGHFFSGINSLLTCKLGMSLKEANKYFTRIEKEQPAVDWGIYLKYQAVNEFPSYRIVSSQHDISLYFLQNKHNRDQSKNYLIVYDDEHSSKIFTQNEASQSFAKRIRLRFVKQYGEPLRQWGVDSENQGYSWSDDNINKEIKLSIKHDNEKISVHFEALDHKMVNAYRAQDVESEDRERKRKLNTAF